MVCKLTLDQVENPSRVYDSSSEVASGGSMDQLTDGLNKTWNRLMGLLLHAHFFLWPIMDLFKKT